MSEKGPGGSQSRRHAQRLWWSAEAGVGLLLLFCPLAISTVHPWAIATAAALSLATLCLTAWATVAGRERFSLPAPGAAFAAATAVIAFQLLPLPPSLLGLLDSHTRELFDFVLAPMGRYPAWRPLSLDPPATARELAKALTALSTFLAAAQVGRSRRARARMLGLLGISATLVAVIGFGHALVGASSLFGLFSYSFAAPPFLTTFGNPNHLASFLALGATALLGKVLSVRDRRVATAWAFAYLASGVGVLLTLSRGGIVAFLAAQLMLAVAVHFARESERTGTPLRARSLLVPAGATLVVAVSAYLAWDALAAEWASADSLDKVRASKLSMWPGFVPVVLAHPLFGVGRGAFEAAYQAFQDPAAYVTFTHPESLIFQWICELGLPAGLLLLAASAWALWNGLRRSAGEVERLACAFGVAAVALHELVDFGLELGGLAIPATVAFALLVSRRSGGLSFRTRWALLLPAAAAVAMGASLWMSLHSLRRDGEELAALSQTASAEELSKAVEAAAERHPADYYPHLLAARAWSQEKPLRPERVVSFANRAMYLNPAQSQPHLLAARALRATGHLSQAAIEYRLAFERGETSVVGEVARVFKTPEQMLSAMPQTPNGRASLADTLINRGKLDEAEAVARESLAEGENVPAIQRLARVALLRKQPDEALKLAERVDALAADQPWGINLRVEALLMRGELPKAIELLEGEGLRRFPINGELVLSLAGLKLQQGDTKGCREALRRLPAALDVGLRVRMLGLESAASERDGQGSKAMASMRSAVTLNPRDPNLHWLNAALLERQGRFDQAIREAEEAASLAEGYRPHAQKLRERVEARKKQVEEMERWRAVEGKGEEN